MRLRELALRGAEVKGRTLVLGCVPLDTPTWVSDGGDPYREEFAPGSFAHIDPTRTQLRYQHSPDLLDRLGAGRRLVEDGGWLVGEFAVAKGQRGDHLIDLVESGDLRGVSVGFNPGVDETRADPDGPVTRRVRVKQLVEVSLLDAPAYDRAQVIAVREDQAREAAWKAFQAWRRDMEGWRQ